MEKNEAEAIKKTAADAGLPILCSDYLQSYLRAKKTAKLRQELLWKMGDLSPQDQPASVARLTESR